MRDSNSLDLWSGLPEVNQRAVVHWLAVIAVKAVVVVEMVSPAELGTGERSCPR